MRGANIYTSKVVKILGFQNFSIGVSPMSLIQLFIRFFRHHQYLFGLKNIFRELYLPKMSKLKKMPSKSYLSNFLGYLIGIEEA